MREAATWLRRLLVLGILLTALLPIELEVAFAGPSITAGPTSAILLGGSSLLLLASGLLLRREAAIDLGVATRSRV